MPGNTLDAFDSTRAEIEGRQRIENCVAWLRANMPGYEKAQLVKSAPTVGVRESRRILGDYLLSGEDFDRCARFEDAIACCGYPVDIHQQGQGKTLMQHLPDGEHYQIPYRCLTPRGLSNLLMASRSVSCDARMHSSLRCMPTVINMGEAAGHAAAMSLPGADVRSVNIAELQSRIRKGGGVLEPRPFTPTWPEWFASS